MISRFILQQRLTFLTGMLLASLLLQISCKANSESAPIESGAEQASLGKAQTIADGVLLHEVFLNGGRNKIWIYLPEKKAQKKIPGVLIAAAGSRLFHGMKLGAGDRPEHLPYVQAGYVVIAYELAGELNDNPTKADAKVAIQSFTQSNAGLKNQKAALDFALANIPEIDPEKIYVAGHSSAATHALLVAENEPRIKGCIAYAPVTNISNRLGNQVKALESMNPGFREFIVRSSPLTNVGNLKCPVFLFHADDDDVVPTTETTIFIEALKKTNRSVEFLRVKSGGHYDSMIQQGIPGALKWLEKISTKAN